MSAVEPVTGRSISARIGRTELDRLHSAHGASFYVFDEGRLLENVASMYREFRSIYPNIGIAHSFKTNYVPAVAKAMAKAGAVPEVVSSSEYGMVHRLGLPAARAIVNGPVKSVELLRRALYEGAVVNMDGLEEVERVVAIAEQDPSRSLRVGLRCNFPLPGTDRSRFGIDAENGDLDLAAARLRHCANIVLEGLHCHLGGNRTATSYGYRMEKLIALADRIFPEGPPRWLDIGGGFAGPMTDELRAQFAKPPATYAEYAHETATRMTARYGTSAAAPTLIVEPGMGLMSDTFEFVCRVEATKRIADRSWAITSGSIYNVKPTLNKFNLPVEVVRGVGTTPVPAEWTIGGFTCMEIDIMHSGLRTGLGVGDDLVFLNTGAYTVVMTPPFIETAPAIITVHADGRTSIARRAERLEDLLRTYGPSEDPA